jgi:hypothetical protein
MGFNSPWMFTLSVTFYLTVGPLSVLRTEKGNCTCTIYSCVKIDTREYRSLYALSRKYFCSNQNWDLNECNWKTQGFYLTEFKNKIKIAIFLIFANCCSLIRGWFVNSKFSVEEYRAEMHCILFPCVLKTGSVQALFLFECTDGDNQRHIPAIVHAVNGFLSHFC